MRVRVAVGSKLLVAGHTTALTYIYCLPCQLQPHADPMCPSAIPNTAVSQSSYNQ